MGDSRVSAAIVGLIAVVPYIVAITGSEGFADLGVEINLVKHAVPSVGVLARRGAVGARVGGPFAMLPHSRVDRASY